MPEPVTGSADQRCRTTTQAQITIQAQITTQVSA